MNETYLEHHGVKGMKWGVRKTRYSGTGKASRKVKFHMNNLVGNSARSKRSRGITKAGHISNVNRLTNELSKYGKLSVKQLPASKVKDGETVIQYVLKTDSGVYTAEEYSKNKSQK